MAGRVLRKRWPARWALASLLLHALLLGVAARRQEREPEVAHAAAPAPSQAELDVEVELDTVAPGAASAVTQAAREPEQARSGAAPRRAVPAAAVEMEATAGDAAHEPAGALDPAPAAASPASAPHLSLAQLGVDGVNPFLDRGGADPAAVQAAKTARLQRRLDRSLAQGLSNADVAKGRGSGGPVLRSLEAAVYGSNVPLNGSALFVFVIDGEGRLVSSVLGEGGEDRLAWSRVAHQTAQALAGRLLRGPKGKGVKLTVAVTSHLELPSGADPGLELSAQGVPIKKGGGPRSSKLDLSIFPFPAATLAGDPADIGARARRMVHAHVVSEEVL